jgi:hypothetical protein
LFEELKNLVPPHFLSLYNLERIRHLSRYVACIRIRAQRGTDNPVKETDKAQLLKRYQHHLSRQLSALSEKTTPEKAQKVEDFFWLLEEYKISIFAQELKTAVKVSAKILDKELHGAVHHDLTRFCDSLVLLQGPAKGGPQRPCAGLDPGAAGCSWSGFRPVPDGAWGFHPLPSLTGIRACCAERQKLRAGMSSNNLPFLTLLMPNCLYQTRQNGIQPPGTARHSSLMAAVNQGDILSPPPGAALCQSGSLYLC